MRLAADIFLLIGAAFTLFGAIGLVRMPDVYNRIQAGTKAVTLGALCLLIGVALLFPSWWSKILVIGLLILITNPLGSSTIARALLMAGVEPWKKPRRKTLTHD
ncbi:MAG: monovalent cation/H(+) antiporter subunit G [Candidatus Thiodiazotropha sp.]